MMNNHLVSEKVRDLQNAMNDGITRFYVLQSYDMATHFEWIIYFYFFRRIRYKLVFRW